MQLKLLVLVKLQIRFGNQQRIMRMQTCLQFKDAMEEINQKHVLIFKQHKIKNKCITNLDIKLQSYEKENRLKISSVITSAQMIIDQELAKLG